MKIFPVLLAASITANGVLVATLLLASRAGPPSSGQSSHSPSSLSAISSSAANQNTSGSQTMIAAGKTAGTPWTHLRSDDFEELKQHLVAAGFPPKEVRALLRQAIIDRERAREEAIRGKEENLPYWKSSHPTVPLDAKQRAEIQQGYRETQELKYKYVSGPDSLADDDDALVEAQRRFGKLPLEKLQQLTVVEHDFERQRSELLAHQNNDGKTTHPTAESIRALEQARLVAAAQFLTPEELEQYELRSSPESNSLRFRLAAFRPSEDEFKAIYAIQKQSEANVPTDQTMEQIKAALGPDRFADYSVALTSDGSGGLGQLIARLDLPLTTVTAVNSVRDDINTRAKAVNADSTLTTDQRQAQLEALATEAQEKLVASLGDRGFHAYSDLKGSWLRALKSSHP